MNDIKAGILENLRAGYPFTLPMAPGTPWTSDKAKVYQAVLEGVREGLWRLRGLGKGKGFQLVLSEGEW